MMKGIKFVTQALISISLIGCAPNATVYYRPSVDIESVHEKSHCVPTEKYVYFNIKSKDRTFRVRGYSNTYSHSYSTGTEAQLVVTGKWKEIKYKNDDFYITIPGTDKKIKPTKTYGEIHQYNSDSQFNSGAVFPKQDADKFDVNFPPLIINGEEIKLPVLHVKRTIWVGISPFNC